MNNALSIRKKNRTALLLMVSMLVLFAVLLSLPAYTFTSTVYSQKYTNTFVGDEKYQAGLAEAEAFAGELRAEGADAAVGEEVTERTNSKGEKTSMVAFTVSETFKMNAWSFLFAGLSSSYVLLGVLLCAVLGLGCALAGALFDMDGEYRHLDTRAASLRSAATALFIVALLLIPVFYMTNTYALSRRVSLYSADVITEGKEAFFEQLNRFLFGGEAGKNLDRALKGLSFRCTGSVWLGMLCFGAMILASLQLRYGTVQTALLRILLYFAIAVICIITLYPYYVMLVTAFRSNTETNDMYFLHIFPTRWIWSNLTDIVDRGVLRYLLNSLLIAGGATAIALLCGIPAAYAMARMKFKGKNAFLGFVIMSQMFSPVVLLIGIAQLISTLKLNDSIVGLMLINAAFNQAFAIWLLRGTFLTISPEMEQAGRIDGCTTLGSLWHILLPMAAPGIVTTLIFVFINAWNEYTISTVLISTAANRPITVGITQFSSFNMIEWQYLFAASLLATIPVVILFTCIEKHLTAGLTSGGVKG